MPGFDPDAHRAEQRRGEPRVQNRLAAAVTSHPGKPVQPAAARTGPAEQCRTQGPALTEPGQHPCPLKKPGHGGGRAPGKAR